MIFTKNKKCCMYALIFLIIVCILIKSYTEIKKEIIESLVLWCTVVLPSLFPYLVLSQYIISTGIMNIISTITGPILSRILHTSRNGTNIFLSSLVCGYPSGAICTADLYVSGQMSLHEAQRIICFSNNAGPLFLISAVGTGMIGNTGDGVAIYVIQTLACLCYAFFSGIKSDNISDNASDKVGQVRSKDFSTCIKTSVTTIVNIGGFITASSVICRIIITLISALFPRLPHTEAWIYSIFELSRASEMITRFNMTPLLFATLCAVVSWGGISVILQVKSALPPEIKISRFVKSKIMQASTAFGLGYAYKISGSAKFFTMKTNLIFISFILSVILYLAFVICRAIE